MPPRVSYEAPDECQHCGVPVTPETRRCKNCGKSLSERSGFARKKLAATVVGLLVAVFAGLWAYSDELEQARLQNLQNLENDVFWKATRSTLTDHFGDAVNDGGRTRSRESRSAAMDTASALIAPRDTSR